MGDFDNAKPFYHFSIDDNFSNLVEASINKGSLREHSYFKYLFELREKYLCDVSLYLFYQGNIDGKVRNLSEVNHLGSQLDDSDGKKWLSFGPHALDFDTHPYTQTPQEQAEVFERIYSEIARFSGSDYFSKFVRLHSYTESYELADFFRSKGVKALFSTDREVGSHRMGEEIGTALVDKGTALYKGMRFVRTHYRVENFLNESLSKKDIKNLFERSINRYGYIIFYTHEYEFDDEGMKVVLNSCFEILREMGIPSFKNYD